MADSMVDEVTLQLSDPREGESSLTIEPLLLQAGESLRRRTNRFAVIRIREGSGTFCVDVAAYRFSGNSLLFAVPYQAFCVEADSALAGDVISFHANFFCIETYHAEVGCNGILFNDLYGSPVVGLEGEQATFDELIAAMRNELRDAGLAHSEVLVSYLKIMLVRATRLKLDQQEVDWQPQAKRPAVLDELKTLIEADFRTRHRPAEYAQRLHITPKALAKIVKEHLQKTPTELIRDRILQQAKWELLHTTRPVKQIALGLGFRDVFYFSRLFKRATGCAPTFFRDYETEIRGGRNLSMS